MLALSARAEPLWGAVDAARAADPDLDRALRVTAVRGRATMCGMAGLAHAMLGAFDPALTAMTAAIDAMAGAGGDAWWHAVLLQRRGLIAAWAGRLDAAGADFADSVARLRAVGDTWFLSLALEGTAGVALARGALADAAAHARESVAVFADAPDPWFVSRALDTLAGIAVTAAAPPRARAEEAARLLGAAATLRARCGAEVIGSDRTQHARTLAAAEAALGADFARHWDAGAALDLAGACALAAAADVADPAPASAASIEPAERAAAAPNAPAPLPGPVPHAALAAAEAAVGAAVRVQAFGPMAVTRGGAALGPAELTPAKARELLLYLALHPDGRSKEQIALALWPDASPARVRNLFHVTLHQLRRILGHKDAVAFDGRAYALATAGAEPGVPEVATDVAAVRAAAAAARRADRELVRAGTRGAAAADAAGATVAALEHWRRDLDAARRGPLGEGDDAGEWLTEHQANVRAAWAEGMEALARLHALRDDPAGAAAALEALVAAEPLREGARRGLMAAYTAAGEPARALAHYDALAAVLARELGAAPGRDTRALAEAIRLRA
jgi:DNA-binding SARP family transcriptional activator